MGRPGRKPKLSPKQKDQVRQLLKSGIRQKDVAGIFGVSVMTVSNILNENAAPMPLTPERRIWIERKFWRRVSIQAQHECWLFDNGNLTTYGN